MYVIIRHIMINVFRQMTCTFQMVAEDPHLARKVTIWPEIVLELIDGTYIPDIEDPEPENRLKKGDTSVSVARPHAILVATKDTETLPVNMIEHGIQPSRHIMAGNQCTGL